MLLGRVRRAAVAGSEVPLFGTALCNTIYAATGKRIRKFVAHRDEPRQAQARPCLQRSTTSWLGTGFARAEFPRRVYERLDPDL
jgi:hypothetical protein